METTILRRLMLLRLSWLTVTLLTVMALCGPATPAWADGLDRDALKKGMSLNEVVQAHGQPVRMEWVNLKGQAVFFLFYEAEDCLLCLGTILGKDVLTQEDGRTILPLGFVTERLAGWGRKFYEQAKFPE